MIEALPGTEKGTQPHLEDGSAYRQNRPHPTLPNQEPSLCGWFLTCSKDLACSAGRRPSDLEAAVVAFVSYYCQRYHKALGNVTHQMC